MMGFDSCGTLIKNKTISDTNNFTKACLVFVMGYSLY